jgi:acyl-CoA thioesterase YciA
MILVTKKIVMAKDIGVHGHLFGGTLMAWIDEAAVAYAAEFCHTPSLVTIRVGETIFKKPVKLNNHLRFYAEVSEMGVSSVTLNILVRKYGLHKAEESDICSTSVTLVRIDEDGSPTPISETVRKNFMEKLKGEPVNKTTTEEDKSKIDPGQVSDWFKWKG